ncbi:MAG: outer membrane protein assembly factor BamA [Treponema sp.]|nr:outer membrane protein assembly factor BamA [Treponema sp.]
MKIFFKRCALCFYLISAVTSFCWSQSAEWYQNKPIKDVVFAGLRNIAAADLDGITGSYTGKPFTDELYYDLLGKLYASELFDEINPMFIPYDGAGSAVRIQFTVTERPTISKIEFVGNSKVRRGDLAAAISLKAHDVANQTKIKAAEEAILAAYIAKGFPNIKVSSRVREDKDGMVAITFTIIEGERISIAAFYFEGNKQFPAKTLQSQLVSKTKGILNDGAFSEAKLLEDQRAIIKYYRDRGYIDVKVTPTLQRDTDEKGDVSLSITFTIQEGESYRFGGITFEGNSIFSTEELSKLVRSKQDEIINGTRLDADLERIRDKYYENGYIFNAIDVQGNRGDGYFSYHIVISEHGRAHIESIRIQGNEKTKDSVILREIPMESGDVFSRTKVLEAMQNLYSLQFFSSVVPDMEEGSNENLMNLIFTVEEQSTTEIQMGLTFSGTSDPNTFPISGMFMLSDRNVFGSGNSLGAELNFATDVQSLSLNYTQNYLLNLPLSAGFDLTVSHALRKTPIDSLPPYFNGNEDYAYPDGFDSYQDYYSAGKIPPDEYLMDYDQWRISIGISTGYRWPLIVGNVALGSLGVGGGIRMGVLFNRYDTEQFRPFDPTIRDRNNAWTPSNSLWTSVSLDRRNIFYDPTAGFYISQRFGYYGLLSVEPEHYIKSDIKAEVFFTPLDIPITENWSFRTTFAFHSSVSFILPDFTRELPLIENVNKLAIDGMFNARGWHSEYSHKGFAMWENWVELRIPIIPRLLAWDFFFDAAAVRPDWKTFWSGGKAFLESMRFSYGGGFRFTIPQFPLRLLFAKRFSIDSDGSVKWVGKPSDFPDVVLSFALPTY